MPQNLFLTDNGIKSAQATASKLYRPPPAVPCYSGITFNMIIDGQKRGLAGVPVTHAPSGTGVLWIAHCLRRMSLGEIINLSSEGRNRFREAARRFTPNQETRENTQLPGSPKLRV